MDGPAALGCVIMASGLGTRFGENKLMAPLLGKPLIGWILDATEGLFARRVVVTRHRDVEDYCLRRHAQVIFHALPHRSDTVRLGLEAMDETVSGCLFCPGDQPLISRETLCAFLKSAEEQPEHIWQLRYKGVSASPVLFPRSSFDALKQLPQGKGGSTVLKNNPGQIRFVPARNEWELFDVDSPADLETLKYHLEQ